MRRAPRALLVLTVVACLAGCGGGTSKLDLSSPKAAFKSMWAAAKAGDRDGFLGCFSKETSARLAELEKKLAELDRLDPSGASTTMTDDLLEGAGEASEPQFGAEKIETDQATLEVITEVKVGDGTEKKTETVAFVKEEGNWKVKLALPDPAEIQKTIDKLKAAKADGTKPTSAATTPPAPKPATPAKPGTALKPATAPKAGTAAAPAPRPGTAARPTTAAAPGTAGAPAARPGTGN